VTGSAAPALGRGRARGVRRWSPVYDGLAVWRRRAGWRNAAVTLRETGADEGVPMGSAPDFFNSARIFPSCPCLSSVGAERRHAGVLSGASAELLELASS